MNTGRGEEREVLLLLALFIMVTTACPPSMPLHLGNSDRPVTPRVSEESLGQHSYDLNRAQFETRSAQNLTSGFEVASIPFSKFSRPEGLAFDPDNGFVYVTNAQNVTSVNGSDDVKANTTPTGATPVAVAIDVPSNKVFAANQVNGDVTVISGSTGKVLASISVGRLPSGIVYDESNDLVYVTDYGSSNVSIINATMDNVVGSIAVGSAPLGITVDPVNDRVFVCNYLSNNVSVINGTSNKVVQNISVGTMPSAALFSLVNNRVYVANEGSDNLTVLNASSGAAENWIPVGSSPDGLALDSDTNLLLIANIGSNNVTLINVSTGVGEGSLSLGMGPVDVVYDSMNGCMYVAESLSDSVTVLNASLSVILSPAVTTSDIGLPLSFHARSAGGLPPKDSEFGWQFGDSDTANGTSSSEAHSYASPGDYTVNITVTDSHNYTANANETVLVNPTPNVSTPLVSPSSIDAGQNLTLTTNASLGTPPYSEFLWQGLPSNCSQTSTPFVSCNIPISGTLHVAVIVVDSVGGRSNQSAPISLCVFPLPGIGEVASSRIRADSGQQLVFVARDVANGSGLDVYDWSTSSQSIACNPSISSTLTCVASAPGLAIVSAIVTDSDGGRSGPATASITVSSDPHVSPPSVSPNPVDLGMKVQLNSTVVGGYGSISLDWIGLPQSCSSSTAAFSCTPISPGNYSIALTCTDENNFSSKSGQALLVVNQALTGNATEDYSNSTVGMPVFFAASARGGSGNYSYLWSFDDGSHEAGPNVKHEYVRAGTYKVSVWINDSLGESLQKNLTLSIGPVAIVERPALSVQQEEVYGVLGGLAVIACGLAWVWVHRHHKRS
jgi:YVTN family beta-propeller protein